MKRADTYSVLFFIRKEKKNSKGKVPIYMRITINGKHSEISTKQWIEAERWNSAGAVKGNKSDADSINKTIESLRSKAWSIYMQLQDRYQYVTAEMLKEHFNKQNVERKKLCEIFHEHNQKVNALIGIDYAKSTAKRFETTLNHVHEFLKYKFKKEDIELIQLQYNFIEDFEQYLKTVKNCNHNSALKYVKLVRKVVNIAVKNDWLIKDPFAKYKAKFKDVERGFLSEEELNLLINKEITNERLSIVKDIFIFQCFTSLSDIDIKNLDISKIQVDEKGEKWIISKREKTGTDSNIPLLPIPLQLIEKYQSRPDSEIRKTIFPFRSNQKMNAYLKEIATICGINKKLTTHIARHTFATTVTLLNDVPIESVSKMMGHKNIRTTQIYGKIVDQKVGNDMRKLKTKLYESQL